MKNRPVTIARMFFGAEFNTYHNYIEFMEKFLEASQKKEDLAIRKSIRKRGQSEDYKEYLKAREALKASGIFGGQTTEVSGLLRDSFFVSLYSYFENKLIRECRERKTDQVLLDFDDIRGLDVIERVKKYFTKVLHMNFPSNTQEWELIQNYRIIRNCIVHARGRIDELKDSKERAKLQRFVNNNPYISLDREEEDLVSSIRENGEIYLHKGFCEEACKTIEEFLTILLFDKT